VRWNPNRATDLLASGRTVLNDMAARTAQHGMRQILPPAAPLPVPDDEERLIDDWLKVVSQPALSTRPAPPGDFTARVMARLEAGPVVTPQPIVRTQSSATLAERLCAVGGVFGVSILLVMATCVITALFTPNIAFAVLNAVVGVFVSMILLLGPLFDALNALASNPSLIVAIFALAAGALALWSRVLSPTARITGEA
jgi:hypothetical protein